MTNNQETIARDELATILEKQPARGLGNYARGLIAGLLVGGGITYGALRAYTDILPSRSETVVADAPSVAYEQTLQTLTQRVNSLEQAAATPRSYAALADSIKDYLPERRVVERAPYFDESRVASVVTRELASSPALRRTTTLLESLQRQSGEHEQNLTWLRQHVRDLAPVAFATLTTASGEECIEAALYNHNRERRRYDNGKDVLLCMHPRP